MKVVYYILFKRWEAKQKLPKEEHVRRNTRRNKNPISSKEVYLLNLRKMNVENHRLIRKTKSFKKGIKCITDRPNFLIPNIHASWKSLQVITQGKNLFTKCLLHNFNAF